MDDHSRKDIDPALQRHTHFKNGAVLKALIDQVGLTPDRIDALFKLLVPDVPLDQRTPEQRRIIVMTAIESALFEEIAADSPEKADTLIAHNLQYLMCVNRDAFTEITLPAPTKQSSEIADMLRAAMASAGSKREVMN